MAKQPEMADGERDRGDSRRWQGTVSERQREPGKEQEGKKEQARPQHPVSTVGMTRQNHKKAATAFPCSRKGKICPQVQGHPEGKLSPLGPQGQAQLERAP